MNKITEESINAFCARKRFKKQNMKVEVDHSTNESSLLLHGNRIAFIDINDNLWVDTCGWNTTTTRNRLNGLTGVHVTCKKGELKLNGSLWDGKLIMVV